MAHPIYENYWTDIKYKRMILSCTMLVDCLLVDYYSYSCVEIHLWSAQFCVLCVWNMYSVVFGYDKGWMKLCTYINHIAEFRIPPAHSSFRPLRARTHQIEILSKLSFWLRHVVHNKIYQGKKLRVENRTFYPLFWEVNFAPDIIGTFFWSKKALSRADAVTATVSRLMTHSKKAKVGSVHSGLLQHRLWYSWSVTQGSFQM